MIHSFRLRLALLAALLAGAALLAFGAGSWWLIRNLKSERLESELRGHAEREVGRARDTAGWQATEARLAAGLGIRNGSDFALLVLDLDGDPLYRSPHWPAGLAPARLAWPMQGAAPAGTGKAWQLIGSAHAAASESLLLAQGRPPGPPGPPGLRGPGGDRPGFGPDSPPPGADGRPGIESLPPAEIDRQRNAPPRERFEPRLPLPTPRPPEPEVPTTPAAPVAPVAPIVPIVPIAPAVPTPDREASPASSPEPVARPRPATDPVDRRPSPVSATMAQASDGDLWRIGLAVTPLARVAVAANTRFIDEEMRGIRNAFLGTLPFALLLIGIGGWLFSARALRPLQKLAAATRRVTAQGLSQRIPVQGEDSEFVELIEVYNRMLERLERSFRQAHRFSADAAHELKTPLAILQGQLERAINATEAGSALQIELSGILDEVRRLSTISRKLLLLAQADAGHMAIQRENFDLSRALADLVEDTRMLAPHLEVRGEIPPGIVVAADGSLLLQVLHNLVSNAIKYNVADGWIRITLHVWPRQVEVAVANSSPGIPPGERTRVFERFYRADPAHGRQIEGVGLGLSVSREIARAHGGDIALKADSDGVVRFSLTLPADALPAAATKAPGAP